MLFFFSNSDHYFKEDVLRFLYRKRSTLVVMSLTCNVFASLEPDHSVINSSKLF